MKYLLRIFPFIIFFMIFQTASSSVTDSTDVSYKKLTVGITCAGMLTVSSYYIAQKAWWDGSSSSFHFDDGKDLEYALNYDKIGHFFGGYVVQDMYYDMLKWSSVSESRSLVYSTGMSVLTQIMIDIKDGYARDWGFSFWDVAAGSAGAFYGAFQKKIEYFSDIRPKVSYWKRDDDFETVHKWFIEDMIEDYPNQTYWISVPFSKFTPGEIIPAWLCLSVGTGVDDGIMNWSDGGGKYELYISIDADLEKLSSGSGSNMVRILCKALNYIKLPAPALKIKNGVTFYGLYF